MFALRIAATFAAFALLSLAPHVLHAQETRVSFDTAGRIMTFDEEWNRTIGIFNDVPGFHHAEIYQLTESSFTLEIYATEGTNTVRQRRPLNAAELKALRQRIADALAAMPTVATPGGPYASGGDTTAAGVDQSGRVELIVSSTVLAAGFYGWAFPLAADMESREALATYMIVTAGGFMIPYLATRNGRVTEADASLAQAGGVLGIGHGIWLAMLLDNGNSSYSSALSFGAVTSILEFTAGYYVADGTRMSLGKARMIRNGGALGMVVGAETSGILDLYDGSNDALGAAMPLAFSGLGMWAGALMANNDHYSPGDADVVMNTGLLGGYVPMAAASLFTDFRSDGKPELTASAIGIGVGMWIGHHMIRDHEFSRSDGTLLTLGHVVGAALGVGVSFLMFTNVDSPTPYLTGAALGGIGGFALLWSLLEPDAHGRRTLGMDWNVQIAPQGLTALLAADRMPLPKKGSVPLIGVNARF